jgi:type II secretory pathway component GspD/PulD (secretin)
MRALLLSIVLVCAGCPGNFAAGQQPSRLDRKVAVNIRQVSLRAALEQLFRGSGLSYAVSSGVPDVPITLKFQDTRLEDAVRALMEAASTQVPGITAVREGSVFLVRIAELAEPQSAPAPGPEEAGVAAEEPVWEKIPVNFLEAGSAAVAFGGAVFPGPPRASEEPGSLDGPVGLVPPGLVILGRREDNSLVVRGTPSDIAELRRLLALFDMPPAQFRLRVSTGSLTAETMAVQGQSARLSRPSGTTTFDLTLTPRLDADGRIRVTIEGTLMSSGNRYQVRSSGRLAPGRAIEVAALGRGDGRVRLSVRASVVEEPDFTAETRSH